MKYTTRWQKLNPRRIDILIDKTKYERLHNKPRPNSEVYFKLYEDETDDGVPFEDGEILLFLGEVTNMEGHAIVVNKNGHVYWGWHTERFIEIDDEIVNNIIYENGVFKMKWYKNNYEMGQK